MRFFYQIGVLAYAALLHLASLFHPKAKEWVNGRKNWKKRLPKIDPSKKVYWFHCASLGEFDQGIPVIRQLKAKHPDCYVVVTFFSPSGYLNYHKRNAPVDFACYIPIDTPTNAKHFVNHFQPVATFFVKYEFWTFHIEAVKKTTSKLYSISTSLRPNQHYFSWYGKFFRTTLKQFDYFFAQNQTTVDLLRSIGISTVQLTGDTRFDRVIENKNNLERNPLIEQFIGEETSVFIAGSTWPKDEELMKELLNSNQFEKYIIAPHNVDETHITKLIATIQQPVERYSKQITGQSKVLIVDTIGQLASAYSYGTIAYVGGGFSKSLHNILEPAVFGLPVIFGPIYHKFPEANAFINEGFGFSVQTPEELTSTIAKIQKSTKNIQQLSSQFIEQNKGAALKISEHCF